MSGAKKYNSDSESGDSRDKLFEKLSSIDTVFGGDLLGNPRRIERIVNKLMMLEAMGLFRVEKNPEDSPVVIFLLLLCEYFTKVYDSLKDDSDFKYLQAYVQISTQKETTRFRKRKERERLEPNSNVPNEVILDTYCDDERFFLFLKGFGELTKITDLANRFKQIKIYLSYIG